MTRRGRSEGAGEVKGVTVDGCGGKDGERGRSGWRWVRLFGTVDERAGSPTPGNRGAHIFRGTTLKIKGLPAQLRPVLR